MTSERTASKEIHGAFRTGFLSIGKGDAGEFVAFGRRKFLLGPGGQDYVGDNSYDNQGLLKQTDGPTMDHGVNRRDIG
jgi:hypothetical protein